MPPLTPSCCARPPAPATASAARCRSLWPGRRTCWRSCGGSWGGRRSARRNPRAQSVAHLGRHFAPVVVEALRRELPRVAAQERDREDGHEDRGEVEAGAAVAGDRPRSLRREGVLVAAVLGARGREAVGVEALRVVVDAVRAVARAY